MAILFSGVTNILSEIDAWPVDLVAAGAIAPDGSTITWGLANQQFHLASVTKPLVALAILVAVEEGTLSLDDPAGPPGSTIRHLLSHASGLAPDSNDILATVGTTRIYSNQGYELLGQALATQSGLETDTYLREAIFEPLGLRSTELVGSPAHGANSTVNDLLLVAQELLHPSGNILSTETLTEATSVVFPYLPGVLPGFGTQLENDWGLGFEIKGSKDPHWTPVEASPQTYGHFGRSGSVFWVDPSAKVSLVILGNRDFGEWAPKLWQDLGSSVLRTLSNTATSRNTP